MDGTVGLFLGGLAFCFGCADFGFFGAGSNSSSESEVVLSLSCNSLFLAVDRPPRGLLFFLR